MYVSYMEACGSFLNRMKPCTGRLFYILLEVSFVRLSQVAKVPDSFQFKKGWATGECASGCNPRALLQCKALGLSRHNDP